MLHRRKLGWAGLLVIVLLLTSASAALAQGGSGDKYVFGSSYELPAGETLNGNLYVAGGSAILGKSSTVSGNVSVAGGSVSIAGNVHGDVNIVGGSVNLDSTAVVDGSLNRVGGSIREAPGAVVRGTRQNGTTPRFNPPAPVVPARPVAPRLAENPINGVVQAILRFFGALGMGLLLALIAVVVLLVVPGPTGQVATTVAREPALTFTAGLLTLVLATLIGFPLLIACGLGLLVWLISLIALIFGWIAVGLWVGQRIFALLKLQTASSLAEAAIGVFLITWLAWVSPRCIGFIFGLAVGSIGMGAVLLTRFGTQPSSGLGGFGERPGTGGSVGLTPYAIPGSAQSGSGEPETRVSQDSISAVGNPLVGLPVDQPAEVSPDAGVPMAPEPATIIDLGAQVDESGGDAALGAEILAAENEGMVTKASLPRKSIAAGEAATVTRAGSGSLEDLEAVNGITPEIAARLRNAGSTTLIALAATDIATLAGQARVSPDQVEQQDWIGQARRLLG